MAKKQQEQNNESKSKLQLHVHDYSERAIALTGDTKPIKDDLKKLGGRYNPRLKCGAGWIFSKKTQADLESYIATGKLPKAKKASNE